MIITPAQSPFAGKTRVRVNGILVENEAVLMVELKSPTRELPFWTPPGGGLQFAEKLQDCLKREFEEETGLLVEVEELCYVSEYVSTPWHAVELYFKVRRTGGVLQIGSDPELPASAQMIRQVKFIPLDQLPDVPVVPEFIVRRLGQDLRDGLNTPVWIR